MRRPYETDDDALRIFNVLSHTWSEGTLQTYGSGLLIFHVFCDARNIPDAERAPADKSLVSIFVASLAGLYSVSAISNYIAGVAAWHTLHRQTWAVDSAELEALIRGAARIAPAPKKKRAAFTADMLVAVMQQLNVTSSLDLAVGAALTTAFWGTARLGEVTVKNLTAFDSSLHPTRLNLRNGTDNNGLPLTTIHLPSTKAAPLAGEDIYWAPQTGSADPRAAMDRHLAHNNPPSDVHLFAYKVATKYVPLTRTNFLKRLKSAAHSAAVPVLPGHSIRIGSTTEYLLRGVPFDVVRAKGRWASDAFFLYLRRHAEIMAPYMQADATVLANFTRIAMPPVR